LPRKDRRTMKNAARNKTLDHRQQTAQRPIIVIRNSRIYSIGELIPRVINLARLDAEAQPKRTRRARKGGRA